MKNIVRMTFLVMLAFILIFGQIGAVIPSGSPVSALSFDPREWPLLPYFIDHPEIPTFLDNFERYLIFDTDREYMLVDHFGGTWTDAEKAADNADDDLMCWALAAANTLEWTGWGFYDGSGTTNSDEIYLEYGNHFTDEGSLTSYAWEWWFDGSWYAADPDDGWSDQDVAGGGDHWDPPYTDATYTVHNDIWAEVMPSIDAYLRNGWAIQLSIYDGGHAITCWGFTYDIAFDKETDPDGYYTGIWVTDSDDDKGNNGPADTIRNRLRYYTVEFDETNGWWYMPNYGSGWHIKAVNALKPYPDETRPVADAGGPYSGNQGEPVSLTASADDDDAALQYRWDFNNDHLWDTPWSSSGTISHVFNENYEDKVVVLISDGRMQDADAASISINMRPLASAGGPYVSNEGTSILFDASASSDPDADTLSYRWDFNNDGTYDTPASASPTVAHTWADDFTGTVTVEVSDGKMSATATASVTVNNVAPVVQTAAPDTPFILPNVMTIDFSGSFTDVGILDTHTALWSWGDGTTQVGTVSAGTVSGTHAFPAYGDFIIQLSVTDDDAGVGSATRTIHVADPDEAFDILNAYIQGLPATAFKEKADQRKKTIDILITSLKKMITEEAYDEAIDTLFETIRDKADDDLSGKTNDWILDITARQDIREMVDYILAYLEYLMVR